MGVHYNPVGWFEIPAVDMERAVAFYSHVFSIRMEPREQNGIKMAWFPMKGSETGAAGSLVAGPGYNPSPGGVLVYFTAPDIEETLGRVREAGGEVLQGRMSIGEYGFVAFITDTEGNRIGLHSRK